eukprot:GHVU01015108.1.p1 GENE.GHVU01015108.1~~GHVU01015108.1.p1  ORF type:complete len:324 (-),score=50.35 GHVU01015108.1:125-988(-)
MDTQSEQREQHLQTRTARAEKERDEALRESDRMGLLIKKQERERGQLERERDQALQEAKQEREKHEATLKELAELRRSHQRPAIGDSGVQAGKVAMVSLVEGCLISRAAEALRRREVTKTLVGIATREQVYQAVTSQQQQNCRCFDATQATLTVGTPLPDISTHPELQVHVGRMLKSLTVRQPVNLDNGPLGDFEIDEAADRSLVKDALRTGMSNPAAFRVLEDSLCVDAQMTAQTRVLTGWLSAQQLPLPEASMMTATPPVARVEVVTTAPAAGSSKDSRPPADQQ